MDDRGRAAFPPATEAAPSSADPTTVGPAERRGTEAWRGEDAWIVARARRGDQEAFGQLYARYARAVHGVLLARGPWQEADDLVQDVFVTAIERLSSLRDGASFGPWLLAIARHRAIDAFRRPRGEELPEDLAHDPRRAMEAREILATIRRLPEAYRETLLLRLLEGMSGPEISARTGLTEGSVRVNLHRGMKLLKAALGR